MTESITKKCTVIIMDGSHSGLVGNIIELVDHITKELFVKSTCRQLDRRHPTMLVVETTMDDERYEKLQHLLDTRYPGLCVYNPPME